MLVSYSPYDLSLPLLYADYSRVETWWNYQDVISPFYRLYLITKGKGKVYINQKDNFSLYPSLLSIVMNAMTLWNIIISVFSMRRKEGKVSAIR